MTLGVSGTVFNAAIGKYNVTFFKDLLQQYYNGQTKSKKTISQMDWKCFEWE